MKKIISLFLAAVMFVTINAEVVSVFAVDEVSVINDVFSDNSNQTEEENDALQNLGDFSQKLNALIEKYPNENPYSKIVVDVNANTIQKDEENAVSLSEYGIDYSDVNITVPVMPAEAVLDQMGAETEVDEETGEIVADFGEGEERYSFAENADAKAKSAEPEIVDSYIENGVQQVITEDGSFERPVGYMTEEQAEEALNLETEYADGRFFISNPYQTKRLIVTVKNGGKLKNTYSAVDSVNDGNGYYVLQYDNEEAAKTAYEKFLNDSSVNTVSCDKVVSSTALPSREGAELIQSDRYKKYLADNSKNSQVIVAVVDTGVDTTHPFLKNRVLKGKSFAYDSADENDVSDANGHGTHVAGIIADNTPSNVKILPVRVMESDGRGYNTNIALGIRYAVEYGADVINLSLGGICYDKCEMEYAVEEAIKAGVTVCVAAGNDTYYTDRFCPANISECITVASSENDGSTISYFSNFGEAVDITAPGSDIISCQSGGGYISMSGTSMACPFAAATAAMILTDDPSLKPAQVETKLKSFCTDMLTKGNDIHSGAGLLNFGLLFGDKDINPSGIITRNDNYDTDFYLSNLPFVCETSVFLDNSDSVCTDRTVTITNSNPEVAEYDGRLITPKKSGKTVITVSLPNGESKNITVSLKRNELWVDYAAKSYAGGNGTEKSPYLISTPEQLAKFAYDIRTDFYASEKCYKLTKDIDLAGKKWTSAVYVDPDTFGQVMSGFDNDNFRGVFDGNNHLIKNMDVFFNHVTSYWQSPDFIKNIWYASNKGFFSVIEGGSVKNLGIVDANCVTDSGILSNYVMENSRISNCFTTGFSAGSGFVDQIVNYDIKIENCFSSATVLKSGFCDSVYSSMSEGNVTLSNCFFSGVVLDNEKKSEVSGFANRITSYEDYGHTKIYNCFSANSKEIETGFAALNAYSTIANCYYYGKADTVCSSDQAVTELQSKPLDFFKNKASYTTSSDWNEASNWDFEKTWSIDSTINNGFPYLKNMPFIYADPLRNTGTWLDDAAEDYAGGNGTEASPYLISNAQQLAKIAYDYRYGGGKNVYYKLTADIDLGGTMWFPIGGGNNLDAICPGVGVIDKKVFFGNIDGNGKTISNMNVTSQGDYNGFIAIYGSGTIKNLNFANASVKGNNYNGIVCGKNCVKGQIFSCNINGTVRGSDYVGGICGVNTELAQIVGCIAECAVSSLSGISGGICAFNYSYIEKTVLINNSENVESEYLPNQKFVYSNQYFINNCISNIIIAYLEEREGVYNCYCTAENRLFVYSEHKMKTYNLSEITDQNCFEGFDFDNVWKMTENGPQLLNNITIEGEETLPSEYWGVAKSFAAGNGTKDNPYLIETAEQLALATSFYKDNTYFRLIKNINLDGKLWDKPVDRMHSVATIYFDGNNKTISNLTMNNAEGLFDISLVNGYIKNLNLINVRGNAASALIFKVENSVISNCNVSGALTAAIADYNGVELTFVSGLVSETGEGVSIENCSVNMDVCGCSGAASVVSFASSSVDLKNCAVLGSVAGIGGGICGNNLENVYLNCTNSYANVVFDTISGRMQSCKNIYYNSDLMKEYGYPLTTQQMKNQASYEGFDFTNVWDINPDVNNGLPYLRKKENKKINYVLNSGTNAASAELDYIPGNVVTLQTPKRDCYAFEGWYKNADFSGNPVKTISASETNDITLYAKWKKSAIAAGHSYDAGKITKAATCTVNGVKTYTCTKCGITKTEAIKATGHKAVTDNAVAPNCTETGLTEGSHCSVCNAAITAQQIVDATGHTYDNGKITKSATCTANGVKTYTCTVCCATKTEAIEATGHKAVTDKAVAPTCTITGLTEGSHCSVCNAVITAQKTVAATGHIYDNGKMTKAATCTSTGTKKYTCTACGATKTASIKATGHKAVTDKAVAATCTKAGKTAGSHCSVCNTVITAQKTVAATGHTYDKGKVTKAATCTAAGTKTYTCTKCKATKKETIKATGHSYKTTVTKATTKKNGSSVTKCTKCGNVSKKTTIYYPKTITLSTTSYTYDGKVKKPGVTVKNSAGKTIAASNYTVTYPSGRKNVGTYTVKVTFKGNYSGSVSKTFKINPKNTSISGLTAQSKAFTVKLKKYTTQTTGYQIQYSTNSNFKNAKTVTVKNSTTSKKISKLSGKKKYYVRVRTYKTVGKTNYYSSWSKAKTVTTKK